MDTLAELIQATDYLRGNVQETFFHVGDNMETENVVGSIKRDKGILMRAFDRTCREQVENARFFQIINCSCTAFYGR